MSGRSLILAGGGLKVGYQAGVLQVWLDEAGLTFDHADGASGGVLQPGDVLPGHDRPADRRQLAQPRSVPAGGRQSRGDLADGVRRSSRYDNFREKVLPFWKIDFNKIRQSSRVGTFNVFNFSKKQLEVVPQTRDDGRSSHRGRVAADVVSAGRRSTATPTSTPCTSATPTSKRRCGGAPTRSGRSGR